MGLWCIEHGISRTQYKSLRDIMNMVPYTMIDKWPATLQTLQRRTKGHMPLLAVRKQPVKLASHKLSAETAQRRLENQQNEDKIPRADLYFFDMKELFRLILQSDLTAKMYRGMMEWKDKAKAIELWNSMSWESSNKTTSGNFAHDSNGKPLFVSDFVEFRCNKYGCRCRRNVSPGDIHFGSHSLCWYQSNQGKQTQRQVKTRQCAYRTDTGQAMLSWRFKSVLDPVIRSSAPLLL